MPTHSPLSSRPSKFVPVLRIPVLLATALMTMGSGMGNPGCGSGSSSSPAEPTCEKGCAIAGSYQLAFDDASPLPDGCKAMNVTLPRGPLELSYANTELTATLNGVDLSGYYYGAPDLTFLLGGSHDVTDKTWYHVSLKADVSPSPETDATPVTLRGTYEVSTYTSEENGPACVFRRTYKAYR
ncbi:hypothetical protein [Corallococcus terminator]|uniref:Uncharacterized protein n=1 Tax=Corallococcus terminator TaxID=2316733 RepID=A0A3A8JFD4_9BACT|nr:hypothetical protein [Corallococcus terminator]RKG93676.1 hypothetical protein D7V88_01665 [Corallococcus terminator]